MKITKRNKKRKTVKYEKLRVGDIFQYILDIEDGNLQPVTYMKTSSGLAICLDDGTETEFRNNELMIPIKANLIIELE